MTHPFRPFGPLRWLLPKIGGKRRWSLIGTLSPEDRCLSVLNQLYATKEIECAELIRIEPNERKENPKFREKFNRKLNKNQRLAERQAKSILRVHRTDVLCNEGTLIQTLTEVISLCSSNLIIDISAMPKRFFIPLVTLAVENQKLNSLLITYTTPEKHGESIAEDPQPWRALPMYGTAPSRHETETKLVISVGYLPLRLREKADGRKFNASNVELLLPFPSIHPGFQKNWEFVSQIKQQIPQLRSSSIKRVPTSNTPIAFEKIVAITNSGETQCVLAPFGPKPISLAMNLYGIACRRRGIPIEIGYTQPQIYADNYSSGISMKDNLPNTTCYCVVADGHFFYDF